MILDNIKKSLNKKTKSIIAILVVVAVIISGAIIIKTNETAVYTYALYTLMPKTVSAEDMNTDCDISVRLNKNFDAKKQASQPLEAFEYYYTDPQSGEEVVVGGTENAVINGEQVPVYLGFIIRAKMNLETMKDIMAKITLAIVAILIVVGIIVWFKVWSKKEDEQKAKIYKNSKSRNKK